MKELKFEALTIEQKLGMVMTAHIFKCADEEQTEANLVYALDMIKAHRLGAVWVDPDFPNLKEVMVRIKTAADYPILILRDAESGVQDEDDAMIGRHNALGVCDSEELAYAFGKVTAVKARDMGYNVVCNPVLDMTKVNSACGATMRGIGSDKYRVAALAAAEAQGMHDGGVLTVGKHYPSACGNPRIDSHMAENCAYDTIEDLLDYNLYPYLELYKKGLLDGIMTAHSRLVNIDPDFPASLSKKVIGIIREQGFEGFAITDALTMMGTVAKFGLDGCRGLAIAGGNDLALIWGPNKEGDASLRKAYQAGIIPDDMIDKAVKRVLAAQHKVLGLNKEAVITEEDMENAKRINTDGIFAKTDDGVDVALDKNKKHYFVVFSQNENQFTKDDEINVATMVNRWYNPVEIADRLRALYPESYVRLCRELPSQHDIYRIVNENGQYDDVVFVTFVDVLAYLGAEGYAPRVYSLIEALQVTNRVSTILHFGNPFVLEGFVHVPRVIIGGASPKSVEAGLAVLSGAYPAKGSLTYDVKLQ